jgi:hippurate hydrolase
MDLNIALEKIREIRHWLHENAELSNQEGATRSYIRGVLDEAGLDEVSELGGGIVGVLHGSRPGRTVGLRADIDALPIVETTGHAYASRTQCMHACGHDGHAAVLIGTAMELCSRRSTIAGDVLFVFQPAEEILLGAHQMLEAGFMERYEPDVMFGFHCWPGKPAGTIVLRRGVSFAASASMNIRIEGRGGHGGRPHETIDPISCSAAVIQGVEAILAREIDPVSPAVVSFGEISAGSAPNIIPDVVTLTGTVRFTDEETGALLEERLRSVTSQIAASRGARCETRFVRQVPPLESDDTYLSLVEETAREQLGEGNVRFLDSPVMVSEDFALFLRQCPGAHFLVGNGEASSPVHTSGFDFNDEIIPPTVSLLAALVGKSLCVD